MLYTELNRYTDKTVTTEIKFNFIINEISYERTVLISHFNPRSEDEITKGITNRYESELLKLQNELVG